MRASAWEARPIDRSPDLSARSRLPAAARNELRTVAIAVSVGVTAGVGVIGIGSRLAMRAIAATSDPRLRGQLTSDQEPIGEVTLGGTIGLILFVGVMGGVLLGVGYVALRWLLPSDLRLRAGSAALVTWCLGARVIFDSEDFDFRFLEPQWLSVVMFSAIFLVGGWAIAGGIEVAERRWPAGRRGWWRYAPILLVGPFFPVLAVAMVVAVVRSSSGLRELAAQPLVLGSARVLVVLVVLWLGVPAVVEVAEIL